MHRIDTADNDPNKHGTGKPGFKDGQPPGSSSTSLDADMFDAFQEEIVGVVEGYGNTTTKTDLGQLLKAIDFKVHAQAAMVWTARTDTGSDTKCIASDHVDNDDTVVVMGNDTNGQRSTDGGLTWASVTGQSQTTVEIAFGNGDFVAVGSGSINIQSSINGSSWVSESTGTGTGNDVIYDTTIGLWCVVGNDGGNPWIVTSPDSTTWIERTPVGSDILNGIASNGTIFVAVGENGEIQTSLNGTSGWTAQAADDSYTDNFNDVVWSGSVFVAVGDQSEVQTSVDGITWVSSAVPDSGSTNEHVWELGGLVVIQGHVDYYNHDKCDGTWLKAPVAGMVPGSSVSATDALSMVYSLGRIVVCDINDNIHTSDPFGFDPTTI